MFFSLPYDKGWKVYVDGQRVETFPIDRGEEKVETEEGTIEYVETDDGAFLGAVLPAGAHEVEIVYTAPGGVVGGIVSGVALALLLIPLALWFFRRRAEKQRNREISLAVLVKNAQPAPAIDATPSENALVEE